MPLQPDEPGSNGESAWIKIWIIIVGLSILVAMWVLIPLKAVPKKIVAGTLCAVTALMWLLVSFAQ